MSTDDARVGRSRPGRLEALEAAVSAFLDSKRMDDDEGRLQAAFMADDPVDEQSIVPCPNCERLERERAEALDHVEGLTYSAADATRERDDYKFSYETDRRRLEAAVEVLGAITDGNGDLRLPTDEAGMERLKTALAAAKEVA